ncbi:MAG: family 43 glycosylhydrolase, partial [Lachnospiraceae bacterium]|nr:family 43 glycosylhydrolase [Lachnospiraceae bacterium]
MMSKQAYNPYLPSYEYIPDAEPYVFDDRVYIYGSHDLFNAPSFCMGDYVCWSAPVDELGNWRYEGIIYRREQDPAAHGSRIFFGLAAPDMVKGPDGRYYLYYFMGGTKKISVAVCDTPAGKFSYYGDVSYSDGTPIGFKGEPFMFDPGVLLDDDGKLYLYVGFALTDNPLLLMGNKPTHEGPMCFRLDPRDMLTVTGRPCYIGVGGL